MVSSARSVPIYFYIPESTIHSFPQEVDEYWSWVVNSGLNFDGRFSWTLQTYLHLKSTLPALFLTSEIPDEGIVIAHRDFLSDSLVPSSKLLLVAIKPDRLPHPSAPVHIVQSLCDPLLENDDTNSTYFIPSWPQPNLISRDPGRGDKFENASFFGRSEHLATELKQINLSETIGLNWSIKPLSNWTDYQNTDLVIAIRYMGLNRPCNTPLSEDARIKPFAKLTNSWIAGVPAILGHEPSYLSIKKSELDYLEATSLKDLIDAVSTLRLNKELRQAMVENGRCRSTEYSTKSIKKLWIKLLHNILPEKFEQWQSKSFRLAFLERQKTACLPSLTV